MDTDASLFTTGFIRLEAYLNNLTTAHKDLNEFWLGSEYDWDKNRIKIYSTYKFLGSKTRSRFKDYTIAEFKEACSEILRTLRIHGLVDPDAGKTYFDRGFTYSSFFSQFGFVRKNQPADWSKKLDHIFDLQVIVSLKPKVTCKGPLLSKSILFVE